jgi:hypothetical protein
MKHHSFVNLRPCVHGNAEVYRIEDDYHSSIRLTFKIEQSTLHYWYSKYPLPDETHASGSVGSRSAVSLVEPHPQSREVIKSHRIEMTDRFSQAGGEATRVGI